MSNPAEILSLITKQPINKEFGAPLAQAFELTFGSKAGKTDYAAASFTCTLFLSSMLAGFPTMKLHTFVKNCCEELTFNFDCKSYDKILANIKQSKMLLLDNKLEYTEREISEKDITEALDFFTNK